jgi:predicted ATPase
MDKLIVDLIPELQLIVGGQPPVPDVSPLDAQRRFQSLFRRFIGVFARPSASAGPVSRRLLQWLDAPTLDLLEDLLTRPELRQLLRIGAYRDNEVDATHPLPRKLEPISRAGGVVKDISLGRLTGDHLRQLLADAFRCEAQRGAPLAKLVQEKTDGNPFFAIQFPASLADDDMLAFDHEAAAGSWDLDHIHAKAFTDNVVDLMVGKLTRPRRRHRRRCSNGLSQKRCRHQNPFERLLTRRRTRCTRRSGKDSGNDWSNNRMVRLRSSTTVFRKQPIH